MRKRLGSIVLGVLMSLMIVVDGIISIAVSIKGWWEENW